MFEDIFEDRILQLKYRLGRDYGEKTCLMIIYRGKKAEKIPYFRVTAGIIGELAKPLNLSREKGKVEIYCDIVDDNCVTLKLTGENEKDFLIFHANPEEITIEASYTNPIELDEIEKMFAIVVGDKIPKERFKRNKKTARKVKMSFLKKEFKFVP